MYKLKFYEQKFYELKYVVEKYLSYLSPNELVASYATSFDVSKEESLTA